MIIIRQWCSSNHNNSAHDFVSKLPNILIRPSHCWPLRDLEYTTTRQQGTCITHNVLGVKHDRERPIKCKFNPQG